MRPYRALALAGRPDIDDGAGTETDRSAAHPGRLAAMPAPDALSLPTKIPKTTPCKVAWRSPGSAIPRKHFDTSGKSPARLHHPGICRTPMTLADTGLFGRQSLHKWIGEEIRLGRLLLRAKDLKFVLAVIKLGQRFLGWNHIDACAAALPLPLLRGRVGVGESRIRRHQRLPLSLKPLWMRR